MIQTYFQGLLRTVASNENLGASSAQKNRAIRPHFLLYHIRKKFVAP